MSDKNYYEILGVSENAGLNEIQASYRKLAMKYHPDRNPDDKKRAEDKFKEISEAYYVLSDQKRRDEYDAYRKGYGFGRGGQFTGAQGFDFEEILKHFQGGGYGGGQSGYRTRRARASEGMFDDIFNIFQHMGSGGGNEYVYVDNGYGRGGYSHASENTDVNATLAVPEKIARSGGEVLFNHNGKKITLKIKPGTKAGQKLRIRDQGKICGSCGHTGDLIISLNIRN